MAKYKFIGTIHADVEIEVSTDMGYEHALKLSKNMHREYMNGDKRFVSDAEIMLVGLKMSPVIKGAGTEVK